MLKSILKRALFGFIYGVFIGQTILIIKSFFAGDGNFYPVSSYLRAYTNTTIAAVAITVTRFFAINKIVCICKRAATRINPANTAIPFNNIHAFVFFIQSIK